MGRVPRTPVRPAGGRGNQQPLAGGIGEFAWCWTGLMLAKRVLRNEHGPIGR